MVKFLCFVLLSWSMLFARSITADLEYLKVSSVGYGWQSVSLENSYSDAIVVCSNVLPSSSDKEAVVRIQNIASSSFEVKIQRPNDVDPAYSTDVYCIVSDEGSYSIPLKYEAHKVVSHSTNGYASPNDWSASRAEDVSADIQWSYDKPAVLGQVMTYNDSKFSTFWSFDCEDRANRPFQDGMDDGICVGKHVGQIEEERADETLGYIVAEAGIYELKDFSMAIDYGADSVKGVGDDPAYTYTLDKEYTDGVVTKEAEDGGQGGWAVLYGSFPLGSSLDLAIDEETVAGDTTRTHITENVAYWVFLYDPITSAEMKINEVLYRQINSGGDNEEFIEFYVSKSGDLKNYLFSDQDASSHQYRFPKHEVVKGDYVVLHVGDGTDTVEGNVHHFYQNSSEILNNTGDDILLLIPSNDDVTVVDGKSISGVPFDYVAYDNDAVDPIPSSIKGLSLSWDSSENSRLADASTGTSIALTPNAEDSDSSLCWEFSATTDSSQQAQNCSNYIPTRDTIEDTTLTNSLGESNIGLPKMSIIKSSIVLRDGINENNPKRIPGASIRSCFVVDNTGEGTAEDVLINDTLTGEGKESLIYVKSGSLIQDIGVECDCANIDNSDGTISDREVSIAIGEIVNASTDSSKARACAYIEMLIE